MVKAELVARLAQQQGLKMAVAQRSVDTMFTAMTRALSDGRGIEIRGFASFKVKKYKGYQGRNPKTGTPISVKPKRGVVCDRGLLWGTRSNVRSGHEGKWDGREAPL